jgi:hypothetical protein
MSLDRRSLSRVYNLLEALARAPADEHVVVKGHPARAA